MKEKIANIRDHIEKSKLSDESTKILGEFADILDNLHDEMARLSGQVNEIDDDLAMLEEEIFADDDSCGVYECPNCDCECDNSCTDETSPTDDCCETNEEIKGQ